MNTVDTMDIIISYVQGKQTNNGTVDLSKLKTYQSVVRIADKMVDYAA